MSEYPSGNAEYCVEKMGKMDAAVVHLAAGMVVGYPPCPYINQFCNARAQEY